MWILRQLPVALVLYLVIVIPTSVQVVSPHFLFIEPNFSSPPEEINFENFIVQDVHSFQETIFLEAIDKSNISISYIIGIQNKTEIFRITFEGAENRKDVYHISEKGIILADASKRFDQIGSSKGVDHFYHYSLSGKLLEEFSLSIAGNVRYSLINYVVENFDDTYFIIMEWHYYGSGNVYDYIFSWDGTSTNLTQIMPLGSDAIYRRYQFSQNNGTLHIHHFQPINFQDGTVETRYTYSSQTGSFKVTSVNTRHFGSEFRINAANEVFSVHSLETRDRGVVWRIGYENTMDEIEISEGRIEYSASFTYGQKLLGLISVTNLNNKVINQIIQLDPSSGSVVRDTIFLNSIYTGKGDLIMIKPIFVGNIVMLLVIDYANGIGMTDSANTYSKFLVFDFQLNYGVVTGLAPPPLEFHLFGLSFAVIYILIKWGTRRRPTWLVIHFTP